MIYRNPTESIISFKAGNLAYRLPPGAECDIPPNLTYVIKARGLPLVEGTSNGDRVEPTVAIQEPPRYPAGVGHGMASESDEDEEVEHSETVTEAVSKMEKEGVRLPGRKKHR